MGRYKTRLSAGLFGTRFGIMDRQRYQGTGSMLPDNKFLSLYLGYPCSVDAGVDPVEYTKAIIERIRLLREETGQQLRGQLWRLCGIGSRSRPTNKELIEKAEELRESWGYAVYEDTTMMKGDMDLIAKCSYEMGFNAHDVNEVLNFKVIEELDNERIQDVQLFLSHIPDPQDGTIRFLCICGHGLSEAAAVDLHDHPPDDDTKKSTVWPWDFRNCENQYGMNQKASEMATSARKGDIVVFSSGLLTPEWVVKKLRECEKDLRLWILKGMKLGDCEEELRSKVQNTIVIVIDACYSGVWKTRMQQCLTTETLEFTRVILQTSCGENEVSYGHYFMPVFCALQDGSQRTELLESMKENAVNEIGLLYDQNPTFYDSNDSLNRPKQFFFIDDQNVFEHCRKFLSVQDWIALRGIPSEDFSDFFKSFSPNSPHPPNIECFRLATMKINNSPMAFFLIQWKDKKYHIHLHFDNLRNMNLTGVTHVDVINSGVYVDGGMHHNIGKSQKYSHTKKSKRHLFTEVCESKKHITSKDQVAWRKHILPNREAIVTYFKNFAERLLGEEWNQVQWNMNEAKPKDLIRSRSAHFQEVTEKYMHGVNLKSLYDESTQ